MFWAAGLIVLFCARGVLQSAGVYKRRQTEKLMMQIAPYVLAALVSALAFVAYVSRHKRKVNVKLILSKWLQLEASCDD